MSARVIPDLKPNEDYKLLREEIFKIIQQWALCGLDFVFSWNWYSHRPWEGEDTALWNLHRAFHCIVHLLLVYRVTCLNSVNTRLISSLPRQFYPRTLILLLVTRGCRRHQEAWTIKILSILTSGASWQSIRPGLMTATRLSWHRTRSPLPGYKATLSRNNRVICYSPSAIYCPCNNRNNTLMLLIIMDPTFPTFICQ